MVKHVSEDLGSSPGFVVNSGWWLPYSIYSIKKKQTKNTAKSRTATCLDTMCQVQSERFTYINLCESPQQSAMDFLKN